MAMLQEYIDYRHLDKSARQRWKPNVVEGHTIQKSWSDLESWIAASANSDQQLSFDGVRNAIDQKTKPPGSLGQLELLAAQLAMPH